MGMGMMVTVNQTIDFDTAAIVAEEFGFECENVAVKEEDLLETMVGAVVVGESADQLGIAIRRPRINPENIFTKSPHVKFTL